MALVHQLPLQLHWIFPSQAGSAVAHSLAGLVTGADHLVLLLLGGDSLLDSWHQALHSQILNTVSTYNDSSSVHWAAPNWLWSHNKAAKIKWEDGTLFLIWCTVCFVKESDKDTTILNTVSAMYNHISTYQCIQQCPETLACWRWAPPWLEYWSPCSKGTWSVERQPWYGPVKEKMQISILPS